MSLRICLAALLLVTSSCTSLRPVHFSSDPAGARILVDGQDSGFVTPCQIELPNEPLRRIDFVLPGYQSATRFLTTKKRVDVVYWRDAAVGYKTGELAWLSGKGMLPAWAFGNTDSDAEAYDNGAIQPLNQRIFFQYDDAFGGRRIEAYTELLSEVDALPAVCQP